MSGALNIVRPLSHCDLGQALQKAGYVPDAPPQGWYLVPESSLGLRIANDGTGFDSSMQIGMFDVGKEQMGSAEHWQRANGDPLGHEDCEVATL